MNWEAIGAVGELIGAVAVVVTLAAIAVQLRQNTRALRSATFQEISATAALNMELMATHPDLIDLMLKAQTGLAGLSAAERIRFNGMFTMVFRRMESVFIHELLGSIDPKHSEGFKNSSLSILSHAGVLEWWPIGKRAFSQAFVEWIDARISAGDIQNIHFRTGPDTGAEAAKSTEP